MAFSTGFGLLKGATQATTLRAGWSHLPKRKGLASGIIISGSGFGGGLASMYILKLANPDDLEPIMDKHDGNLYYPEDLVKNYPEIQCRLCMILTVIIVIGVLLISNFKKEEEKLPKDQYESQYS